MTIRVTRGSSREEIEALKKVQALNEECSFLDERISQYTQKTTEEDIAFIQETFSHINTIFSTLAYFKNSLATLKQQRPLKNSQKFDLIFTEIDKKLQKIWENFCYSLCIQVVFSSLQNLDSICLTEEDLSRLVRGQGITNKNQFSEDLGNTLATCKDRFFEEEKPNFGH